MFKPNYTMLRLCIIQAHQARQKYPDADQMPRGFICPGYDIELMEPLAVLKYICGVSTQWSCQGNHKEVIRLAYILLPPKESFPKDLERLILSAGFESYKVHDYDENLKETGELREKISSSSDKTLANLKELNASFLETLQNWSRKKIMEHLPTIEKDHYFDDFVALYSNKE